MSTGQVESVAGFVLLAIVLMSLGYLLPALIRSRQVVSDARVDDRFSTNLRVLARAGGTPPRYSSTARVYLHTPSAREPEAPMDRQPAPPASRSAAEARRVAAMRAARAAAASRRAAAARRRRALLLGLVFLTAALWTLFVTITLPIAAPIAASVLLVAAGVAGRRAAVRAAFAETREAERTDRTTHTDRTARTGRNPRRRGGTAGAERAEQESPTTATGPLAVRHARRSSQGEAAPVPAETQERGEATKAGVADDGTGQDAPVAPPTRTPVSERTGSLRISVDPATIDNPVAMDTADGWTPVPVPRPTYTLKAPAPRRDVAAYEAPQWEPAPAPADAEVERELTLAEVEQTVRARTDAQAPPATPEQVLAEQESARLDTQGEAASAAGAASSPAPVAATGTDEAKRPTMDLQSVLERRRAVGQ
ncbi:hypothetical protein ACO0LV_08185 [Pseudactinotalea sp. Z1739]|uniref:hypothetical protein n=1 Tax=Pseudactinotalea sp. Z1739 TaxID=3413028 RepID=UPI003C7D1E39